MITKRLDPGKTIRSTCALSTDLDRDCLNDEQEWQLARMFAPSLFMDEHEDCGPEYNWDPQARFQVRPSENVQGRTVAAWSATDGNVKVIRITYYMNWPLDCGSTWRHTTRHLGDSERFQYELWTVDLNTFVLYSATHNAHGGSANRSGLTMFDNMQATGDNRPIIAVGKNKHSSWWGKGPNSNDCAASGDSTILGVVPTGSDDCFDHDWATDAAGALATYAYPGYNGTVYPLIVERHDNIGEPPRPPLDQTGLPLGQRLIEIVDGGVIQSENLDANNPALGRRYFEFPPSSPAGFGNLDGGREYWWDPPSGYQRFCGFLCRPQDQRFSHGDCHRGNVDIKPGYSESFNNSVHSFACSTGLWDKLDTSSSQFGYPANSTIQGLMAASCEGRSCDTEAFSNMELCRCDDACAYFGDCCADKNSVCGEFKADSCDDKCGRRWTDRTATCSCSYGCENRGDCCADATTLCATELANPPANSCVERCGTGRDANFDCACDHLCAKRGDCCLDKTTWCPVTIDEVVGSCINSCGPTYGSAYGGLCHCDPACIDRGDCCRDAVLICDLSVPQSNLSWPQPIDVTDHFCLAEPAKCRTMEHLYEINISGN